METKPGYKLCNNCKIEKELTDFRVAMRRGVGSHYYLCKPCEKTYDHVRLKDPKVRQRRKETHKAYHVNNKETIQAKARNRYHANIDVERAKSRRKSSTPQSKANQKKWQKENAEYLRAYYRNKRATDPLHKLSANLRNRMGIALKTKKFKKSHKLAQYLGCSLEELVAHLEKQFQPGMSWDNYGKGSDKWNVDHIIPLASANTPEELIKLSHYTNLQPLWQPENMRKSASMPTDK